ncbi:MAG TPA: hypothetical protein DCM40_46435, partial [Maribacter sp.]|nr:hypothetical protein [Maribacter sp.]
MWWKPTSGASSTPFPTDSNLAWWKVVTHDRGCMMVRNHPPGQARPHVFIYPNPRTAARGVIPLSVPMTGMRDIEKRLQKSKLLSDPAMQIDNILLNLS